LPKNQLLSTITLINSIKKGEPMNRSYRKNNPSPLGDLSSSLESKQNENTVETGSPNTHANKMQTEKKSNGILSTRTNEPALTDIPRKIRLLLVITGLASGGATNVVIDLANHFNNHPDFDIHLLTGPVPPGRTDVTHLAYDLGIKTQVIPGLINHLNPITNFKAVAHVRRIMVQGKYDIVHTHSSVAGVVGRLAAWRAGVPVIIHHVHGWAVHQDMSTKMQMLYVALERLCARCTTRLVVVSKEDIEKGLSHRIGSEDKFALIYNGIDLEKFRQPVNAKQVRAELGLDQDSKLVGMIGRLDMQKNPLDFIRTAAVVAERNPKVQFLIVGDGKLRPECELLIDKLNLRAKFFLLGYRDKDDVAKIISVLTITAMSSLWEGLPLAFFEAMSAGKPIVANDVDGAKDVVINGETGFLVTPRQPSEMADRIIYLLNNENLCKKMGDIARQHSNHFSINRMVTQTEIMYKELVALKGYNYSN
jgi:glycosyltransferase involved in cell wall biosynthesis